MSRIPRVFELVIVSSLFTFTLLLQGSGGVPTRLNRAAENVSSALKDDLTTDLAKAIIRLSKSAEMNAFLDTNTSPCDNFYQFACGNWHRNNPAQLLGNIMTDRFQMLVKLFDRRLERILNESTDKEGNFTAIERKAKDFYQSCRLLGNMSIVYELALENVYKEYGELPVLNPEKWNESDFVWWETVAKIQNKYGRKIILAVDIMGDIKNNTMNKVYVGPPDYGFATNTKLFVVLQETTTAKHLEKFFGVERSLAKKTAKEMIEFQRLLSQGGTDSRLGLELEELLALKKVEKLKKTYEGLIDIEKYLQLVLQSEVPESVYVYDEKYLISALKTISETPKSTVANFVLWQLLQDYLVDVKEAERTKWCIEQTKKYFGKFVDFLVYQRYKNVRMEEDVIEMWEEIRKTFRDELKGDKHDWISNATREYAIDKLDAMELEISSYEEENFTEFYEDLSIEKTNYITNIQEILKLQNRENLRRLNESGSSFEFTQALSFTLSYNFLENSIKVPVCLLQPRVFWDDTYPHALKYSTLGYLIAHEMIHGFDDDGRNHDKHGNYYNWWDLKSTYEFEERRKCFQAQYHNYKYGGRYLPESVSQAENIADNAAVKLAYKTYMRWVQSETVYDKDISKKETLPGLAFDNSQLFFVGFAQVWCEDVQSLFKSSLASGESHAPGIYRVIGSLSNFQEFSWVYKCNQDAPMDPEFKCAIY